MAKKCDWDCNLPKKWPDSVLAMPLDHLLKTKNLLRMQLVSYLIIFVYSIAKLTLTPTKLKIQNISSLQFRFCLIIIFSNISKINLMKLVLQLPTYLRDPTQLNYIYLFSFTFQSNKWFPGKKQKSYQNLWSTVYFSYTSNKEYFFCGLWNYTIKMNSSDKSINMWLW